MTTFQVVTILKNTTKLVTDVPFPALTICGSGIHMNNVEKKLTKDFDTWRIGNDRNETNEEAAKKDMEEFMHTRFQIKPSKSEPEELVNILDILNMMIAPDVDASVAASSIIENAAACKQSNQAMKAVCSNSCANPNFKLLGGKCFYVSTAAANYDNAVTACQDQSAVLAKISTQEEDDFVWSLGGGEEVWIGLKLVCSICFAQLLDMDPSTRNELDPSTKLVKFLNVPDSSIDDLVTKY